VQDAPLGFGEGCYRQICPDSSMGPLVSVHLVLCVIWCRLQSTQKMRICKQIKSCSTEGEIYAPVEIRFDHLVVEDKIVRVLEQGKCFEQFS
jgi:hypothetical protein